MRWRNGRPPAMTCDACRQAAQRERQEAERQTAERRRAAEVAAVRADLPAALGRCGVPARWRGAGLELCPDLPAALVEAARTWAESPADMLHLHGVPGSGKTYLAVAALRYVLAEGILPPAKARFISERAYLEGLREGFDGRETSPRRAPASDPRRVRLLVFDDLAAARPTPWRIDELAALIELRHAEEAPTIFTSNWDLAGLAEILDTRATSRIAEGGHVYQFPPVDLRKRGRAAPASGRETGR